MTVLVPVDHSEAAMDAIEYVLGEHPTADIAVLHVLDPFESGVVSDGYATKYVAEGMREDGEELLERIEELAADHVGELETELVVGQPAREIISAAEQEDVEQVVMGSHGRTGLTRVLLGSVAETVVRRAPVPVTIVR